MGKNATELNLSFLPNSATHSQTTLDLLEGKKVTLKPIVESAATEGAQPTTPSEHVYLPERGCTQQKGLPHDAHVPLWAVYKVQFPKAVTTPTDVKSINDEPLFQANLYLFNVVIALEWTPSKGTLQQIRLAAQRASDFLYDVTDGNMAIGNVIIRGQDSMDGADIQVMASNRLHPRAWVDAMHEDAKFMPIRVGRGLWQKNQATLLTWDTPEGYRAITHEWGHYAFALSDEYLARVFLFQSVANGQRWSKAQLEIAAPNLALAVESLMANTQISEFAPRRKIVPSIKKRFPHVIFSDDKPLDGPDALPLDLPKFSGALEPGPDDLVLDLQTVPAQLIPDIQHATVWVYLLRREGNTLIPKRIIAQGKIGQRDWKTGFRLLGAEVNDEIVLISQFGDEARVVTNMIYPPDADQKQIRSDTWKDRTPAALKEQGQLFVDVIPSMPESNGAGGYRRWSNVSVRVETDHAPRSVTLFPLGKAERKDISTHEDTIWGPMDVEHLDGHVLLQWDDVNQPNNIDLDTASLLICAYSQGGGGSTSGGGQCLPMTGGSPEGNAMIFFLENTPPFDDGPSKGDEGVRIVTTVMTVGRQTLDDKSEARSYTFSIASNAPLAAYPATLVLYYDSAAPGPDQDLRVYRWNEAQQWEQQTTFDPSDMEYVAVPITVDVRDAAPNLLKTQGPYVDRYRVFLTPRR